MKIKFSKLIVPFLVACTSLSVHADNSNYYHQQSKPSRVGRVLSDSAITAKVKSKIAMDPSVSVFKVDVSTSRGIVLLTGSVNSDTDASALVQLAQSTDGVRDVDTSKLKVKNSAQPVTDTMITAKIKGTYIREKLVGNNVVASISVETNNGIVYLSGNVQNRQQMYNAIALAKAIHGVKHVESRLQISNS